MSAEKPNDTPEKPDPRPPEADSDADPSVWELVGRNVGRGWKAAKAVSGRIGAEASVYLDRQRAEEHLDGRYRVLGRIVAEQLTDWHRQSVTASDPAVRQLLEEIRDGHTELARLQKIVEEKEARES